MTVRFDDKEVDSQIKATGLRLIDDRRILSWRDLYGAEVTIYVPGVAPPGTEFTRVRMTFMTGAQFGKSIEIPLGEKGKRLGDYKERYVHILTEKELGPEPDLLR